MSRHVARRAFSLATSVAPARAARAATAPSTSFARAVAAFAPSSSSPSPSPPLARAFASGLTINGGVTPAVDAVPESIVLVPREEAPAIDAERGVEVRPKDVFGVVEVRSHQFKVSPDDLIFVDKIKDVEVNDVVRLPRVLMLGSKTRTVIGRPTVPGAEVLALVEEHVRDGKKFIFKKKRRKNYRRMNGYRAQLTGLRVLEVRGIEE